MKNLDLATYGVEEMDEVQMNEVNGGGWGIALAVVALALYLYDNRDSFSEGFEQGMKAGEGAWGG